MSDDVEADAEATAPIWAFGDLMSVLLGAFVLILVGVIGVQLQLSHKLEVAEQQRQAELQRRTTLEQALATPLALGRVTLVNGRIGIRGNLLFALNSDQLQPDGRQLIQSLATPLAQYLQSRDELLMVNETQAFLMHTPDRRAFSAASLGVSEAQLTAWRRRF